MPRCFQFSLRALLVAVLVVAVATWAFILQPRSAEFRDRAEWVRVVAAKMNEFANPDPAPFYFYELTDHGWQEATPRPLSAEEKKRNDAWHEYYVKVVVYYNSLALKYEEAARCPWLPVEPDQPPPEAGQLAVDEWLEQVKTWPDSAVAIEQ